METQIKLYGVKWDVTTAGPSPDNNKRTEIFLFGCQRAVNGNPCVGCFNKPLWDSSVATFTYTAEEIVKNINTHASNPFVTIGGGEPTDQIGGLLELTSTLKYNGYHVIIYTWKKVQDILAGVYGDAFNLLFQSVMNQVDIIIDGEFKPEECLYDDSKGDGLLSSVGSGNQIIWDLHNRIGYAMRDLKAIHLDDNHELIYTIKNDNKIELK